MGLEAGTYISDLAPANPVSSDKKNVGDDHLRLIKAVLQGTLPNASRAYRFPEVVTKTIDYAGVAADENKFILCDTTIGQYTVTLPTPTFGGWIVTVIKTSADVNPVFVAPPSGTINGLAKMRLNVPYMEYRFLWTGAAFIRVKSASEAVPGSLQDYGGTLPVGYALATGQSLVRADHPELFAAWGTTYGFADGTHFNAPNAVDRVTLGAGSTYGLAAVGGVAGGTQTLVAANLPPHSHFGTTGVENEGHQHAVGPGQPPNTNGQFTGIGGTGWGGATGSNNTGNALAPHHHPFTTDNGPGSSQGFSILPPYIAVNKIFRLC